MWGCRVAFFKIELMCYAHKYNLTHDKDKPPTLPTKFMIFSDEGCNGKNPKHVVKRAWDFSLG